MSSSEPVTHSFVVTLWVEADPGTQRRVWYGQIRHFPSDEQQYVTSLDAIVDFIQKFLDGAEGKSGERVKGSIVDWLINPQKDDD